MKNHARRIEKIESELNSARPDDSAWWENFKKRDPEGAKIHEEFFEKHADDPKFQKECTEDRWSDETIDEFVDYVLARRQEQGPPKQMRRF